MKYLSKYGRQGDSTTYNSDANPHNQHNKRTDKGWILPFPKERDVGIAKNYRCITLTSIAAKRYATTLNRKFTRYLGRTKMAFGEIDPQHCKF